MRTESERRQLLEGISQNVNHKVGGGGGGGGGKEKGEDHAFNVGVQNLGMLGLSVPKPLIITIHQGKCLSLSVSKLTFFIIIIYRGVTGMLITLVLLIFSALDVLFFFLPTANFDSRVVR